MKTPGTHDKAFFFFVALLSAGTLWTAGAGHAVAPEPASLYSSLSGNGSNVSAYYVSSGAGTRAHQWYSGYVYAGHLANENGAPCETYAAPAGTQTTKVLQVVKTSSGSVYARCL